MMTMILQRIMEVFCPPSLGGLWRDHVDELDHPIRADVPASTLYHLYFGITSVEDVFGA